MARRIPRWAYWLSGLGIAGGMAVIIKDRFGGPDFETPVDLTGKVAVVTGGNTGIGFEVAKGLAARGAKVYLACRDKDRCTAAREDIFIATDNKNVLCRYCDLASLESVKRFSRRFRKDEQKLDILVNNAGTMWGPREITPDAIEMQLGVNHMGHFLLTNLLVDKLKSAAPSRVVNVASRAHYRGKINVKDLNSTENYSESGAYSQSKLANVLFTRELASRLEGTGVTVNAVHPGLVDTNIVRNTGTFTSILLAILRPFVWPFIKSPEKGAQAVLHVALHPELAEVSGKYFNGQEIAEPSEEAKNDKLALWLWLTSEKWTKLEDAMKECDVQSWSVRSGEHHDISTPSINPQTVKPQAVKVKTVPQDVASKLASTPLPS